MHNSSEHISREAQTWIGKRVEIPVHYDLWMQGARYGVVTGWRKGKPGMSAVLLVRMDHPQVRRCARIARLDWQHMRVY